MSHYDDIPVPILRAQLRGTLARETGELAVEIIEADDGGDRKRIADRLRAIADKLEAEA